MHPLNNFFQFLFFSSFPICSRSWTWFFKPTGHRVYVWSEIRLFFWYLCLVFFSIFFSKFGQGHEQYCVSSSSTLLHLLKPHKSCAAHGILFAETHKKPFTKFVTSPVGDNLLKNQIIGFSAPVNAKFSKLLRRHFFVITPASSLWLPFPKIRVSYGDSTDPWWRSS